MRFLLFFLCCTSLSSYAQEPIRVAQFGNPGTEHVRFKYSIFEEEAEQLLDTLFAHYHQSPGADGLHRFRRKSIEGFDHTLTIHADEYLVTRTSDSTATARFLYNKREKQAHPASMKPEERWGLSIYFSYNNRISHHNCIDSPDKNQAALRFLYALLEVDEQNDAPINVE